MHRSHSVVATRPWSATSRPRSVVAGLLLPALLGSIVLAGCAEPTSPGLGRDAPTTAPSVDNDTVGVGAAGATPSTRLPHGSVRCLGVAIAFELLLAEPQAFVVLPPSARGIDLFRRHIADVGALIPPEVASAYAVMSGILGEVADLWAAPAGAAGPPSGDAHDPARRAADRLDQADAVGARRAVERHLDEMCARG